jgi:hypothetical protein
MARTARKVQEGEFFPMPPDMVFVNRLQFGFYSVLARLDVEVDYATVERTFLAAATSPSGSPTASVVTSQDADGCAAASAAPRAPMPATREEESTPRTRSA